MDELKQSKTSPGPWQVEFGKRGDLDVVVGIRDAKGNRVVETDSGYYPPRLEDAKLIAKAPELRDCLEEAVAKMCSECYLGDCHCGNVDCVAGKWKAVLDSIKGV